MTNVQKIFLGVCVAGFLGFLLPSGVYWYYLNRFASSPGPNLGTVEIEILPGTNAKQIGRILEEKMVISSAKAFYHYLRVIARNGPALRAGDYEFVAGETPEQIINAMQKGHTKELRFTIPEGASKIEIAQIIEDSGLASKDEILAAMEDPELISAFGVPKKGSAGQREEVTGGIEGYLFPDTYQFPKKTRPKAILERMRERLNQIFDDNMTQRQHQLGMSFHKVLTLASIVEKETGDPAERPQIASVFYNRLGKGMKLQTDPTVIYSISDYDGKISKAHLKLANPYNTYVREGLPPGPIASPGIEAIRAVLWPAATQFLYFVSRNDGTHVFCPNYQCHQKAVRLWQIDYFREKKKNAATSLRNTVNNTATN